MAGSAVTRFWRGVREPWDLLARMRQVRPLWSRYWRTVLVQAALTLVAGLGVFWVGKQGADAWNDAFGPDEPETSAPASASTEPAPAPAQVAAPGAPAKAPQTPGRTDGTSGTEKHSASPAKKAAGTQGMTPAPGTAAPKAPSTAPAAPLPPPPGEKGTPATSSAPQSSASQASSDDEEKDEDEKDADEEGTDEVLNEAALQSKIEALKNAPPEERGRRTAELVAAAVREAQTKAQKKAAKATKAKGQSKEEEVADERESLMERLDELTSASETLAREPPKGRGEARRARKRLERGLNEVEKEAAALVRRGAAPMSEGELARLHRGRAALQAAHRNERGLAGRWGAVLALLAAIYASLGIAQTGILALSRDFHDVLSRDLSLLVNVAPEDPPFRPKVRLDLPWVRRKANRRAQFFLGFLPGTLLITVVGWLVPPHRTLTTVLTAIWAAYWWTVMTAGQSARAWTPPETTPRPWYLRAWFALTDRVFLFRWGVPRAWGRLWERFARRFYGPSERVEEQPLEFAGLSLSRALLLVPVVKLLFRPLFPVCAAHLLVEHAAQARLPVPVTATEVAEAAARAPDAEARAHSGAVIAR
jgi:chemotaxis protein histidine kinase CheA